MRGVTGQRTAIVPVALVLGAALLAGACKGSERAQPKRVTGTPVAAPPRRPERTGPFRDPKLDGPGERTEPQLPPGQLAETLAEARAAEARGDLAMVRIVLRRCANRVPISIECEGRLALALLPVKNRKAEAEYYLAEAIRAEGEHAPDLDRRLADAALARGKPDLAAVALARVVARPDATADDWVALARALSADPARLGESADAYAKALALRDVPDWRHERATVLAQAGRKDEAIADFEAFLAATKGQDPERDRKVRLRIEELRTGRVADGAAERKR